jgi:hypothetical protein
MKILISILFVIFYHVVFSQSDTIQVNIAEMSIDFKTCECILFGDCRKYSHPVKADWKKADSLFIGNSDTIYFLLQDHGVTKIEGHKLPESEVYGIVHFYNKESELTKIEIWEEYYLQHGNDWASWSDAPDWKKQMVYSNNELIRETTKSIIYDEKKGFARRIEVIYYKNGIKRKTKIKNQYF